MIDWFPQEYAHEFYVAKGLLALTATIGIVWHMSRTWHLVETRGRRLRYYSLLYFAVLITYASVEQTAAGASVELRNIGAAIGVALALYATYVSLGEDRPRTKR